MSKLKSRPAKLTIWACVSIYVATFVWALIELARL